MRTAVVGHVEWIRFAAVERLPKPGEIIHALESWLEPAGGGAVAAAELLRLAGNCDFFVAVGNDETGREAREGLEEVGLRVHAAVRAEPQRIGFTYLEENGERTITLVGEKLHPHGKRSAAVERAGADRRRLLHRRRRGRATGGSAGSRARGDRARTADSRRSRRPAGRARPQRDRPGGDLRAGSDRSGADARGHDQGTSGRQFQSRQSSGLVRRRSAPRSGQRRVRGGRLLRCGPGVRSRSWRQRRGGPRLRVRPWG